MNPRIRQQLAIALAVGMLLGTAPGLAQLTARLSSPQIDETQTLELTIRSDSRDVEGSPDLSGITNDFEVLTTRKNSQYRVINGNVQAWTDWIIALRPLRTGTLRIPALSYRGESTEPLELRVLPLDPAIKRQMGKRVFFETSTEPESPYVQAQLIYVRRLLYADGTQIYGEMPDTPAIEDAVVIALGNATSSTVTRDGQRYGMIEQRYAIFPERSGKLEIPGAVVSGSVRMNINGRLKRNGVRVIAEPSTVTVRPIPSSYPPNTPWLPATRVELLEAWDKTPLVFELGKSLSQTLIVRSDSATGSLIPPLEYEIPASHFRTYPEQPNIADNQRPAGLIGTRSQTWSIIPTQAGNVTLPPVSLTWFDTASETVRTASIARRPVSIAGDNGATGVTETTDTESTEAKSPETVAEPVMASDRRLLTGPAAMTLVALALIALLLWRFTSLRDRLRRLLDGGDRLIPRRLRLRASRRALLESFNTESPTAMLASLANCVEMHETANRPVNSQIHQQIVRMLERCIYAPVASEPERAELTALAETLFDRPGRTAHNSTLPALYPTPRRP